MHTCTVSHLHKAIMAGGWSEWGLITLDRSVERLVGWLDGWMVAGWLAGWQRLHRAGYRRGRRRMYPWFSMAADFHFPIGPHARGRDLEAHFKGHDDSTFFSTIVSNNSARTRFRSQIEDWVVGRQTDTRDPAKDFEIIYSNFECVPLILCAFPFISLDAAGYN